MNFFKSTVLGCALFTVTLVCLHACNGVGTNTTKLVDTAEVQKFIQYMVDKHQFDPQKLTTLFAKANIKPEVIVKMKTPYEAKPWYTYEKFFITPERIKKGVQFWQSQHQTLAEVQKVYHVPTNIIIAIIGIESFYGPVKGNYPVLDSLATLAFHYPPRGTFFCKELEEFLLLCREQNWDALTIVGSYAGALGQPQFIPSSYRAYAVDFNHTGKIDLFNNVNDVISSVANYLRVHGWQDGAPIAVPAQLVGDKYVSVLGEGKLVKPSMSLAELAKYGVGYADKQGIPESTQASLFQLEVAPNQFEYWLGFNNLYVITRYNTSVLYAMAVANLASSIEKDYKQNRQ